LVWIHSCSVILYFLFELRAVSQLEGFALKV